MVAALAGAGAVVFFVSRGWPSSQRPPFDMPVADSEIVFGAYTEYTGLRFAFFLLAEYAGIVVLSRADRRAVPRRLAGAVAATSSAGCGRWSRRSRSPFVVIWLRVAWPRLREDQLQRLAWLVLVPLALAQLALTGVVGGGDRMSEPSADDEARARHRHCRACSRAWRSRCAR